MNRGGWQVLNRRVPQVPVLHLGFWTPLEGGSTRPVSVPERLFRQN